MRIVRNIETIIHIQDYLLKSSTRKEQKLWILQYITVPYNFRPIQTKSVNREYLSEYICFSNNKLHKGLNSFTFKTPYAVSLHTSGNAITILQIKNKNLNATLTIFPS